jgi:hypothetical protein
MKMFQNFSTENLEDSKDVVGGGGFIKDTGIYKGTVKLAYAKDSGSSDAKAVALHIDIDGTEYREDFWVINKKGENFYQDKKDAKKHHPLPGYTSIDDLCLLTCEKGLSDMEAEEKTVKLYDFEAKKELPTQVPVLSELIDKEITVAIVRQTVDKNTKQDDGSYVPSGETRDENVIEKFFHEPTNLTVVEARAGIEEPAFYDKWKTANEGKPPRNRSKGVTAGGGSAGRSGAPGASSAGGAKPSGLFGKKSA